MFLNLNILKDLQIQKNFKMFFKWLNFGKIGKNYQLHIILSVKYSDLRIKI
jgi:hypothetical protein